MTVKTTDTYDLRKRAILVKVNTSVLGTQKKDQEATAKAALDHNANKDQIFVGKNIVNRKNPLFKKLDKIRGLIRNTHLTSTGPWDDDWRVISTKKYGSYRQVIEDLFAQAWEAVDEIVKYWEDLKAEAKINLGDLYDESLYPSVDHLRASFSFELETEVLPDRANTILDLDKARTDKIVADAKALDEKRVETLTDHTHKVVREELEGMVAALAEFGDDIPDTKRTRTFRDSLTKRMSALADTLPGLNITGDVKLDKLAKKIAAKLTIADAAELRGDKKKGDNRTDARREAEAATKREEVSNDAKEILNDLDGVFGNPAA